jgi:error-prone DNA polymerase
VVFVNLEDETGMVNVIVPIAIWERHKQIALTAPALLVRGKVEKADGALNVLAVKLEPLAPFTGAAGLRSRDFR